MVRSSSSSLLSSVAASVDAESAAASVPLEPGDGVDSSASSPGGAALWQTIAAWALDELRRDPSYTDADRFTIALLADKRLRRIADPTDEDRCREVAGAAFETLMAYRLARATS